MLDAFGKRVLRVVQPHLRLGDPHICSDDRHRLSLLHAVYEPLVRRAAHGRFVPALASSWTVAEDAHAWRFSLRPGARWHDGPAVSVADVCASLERIRDAAPAGELGTSGVYASYLRGSELRVVGRHDIEIRFTEPMADALDILAELFILPMDDLGVARPAGSGSYSFAEADAMQVVLERVAGGGGWPRVVWRAESDATARLEAVVRGVADVASDIPSRSVAARTFWQSSSVTTTFMFALGQAGVNDARIRRAINYAVDVDSIVEELFAGRADRTSSPCTPPQLGFDPNLAAYPHDPALARQLLAEAGAEGLTLTFDIPKRLPDEAPMLATRLAEQLQRVGVALKVNEHEDRTAYAEMVRAGNIHDAACFDSSPTSTFRLFMEKFHAGVAGVWWLGYEQPEFDRLVDIGRRTVDVDQRALLYRAAARRLHQDAPWLYLYGPHLGWAVGPSEPGWRPTPDGLISLAPQIGVGRAF
jgi:peptide/nickel transport system substrate-binding protein